MAYVHCFTFIVAAVAVGTWTVGDAAAGDTVVYTLGGNTLFFNNIMNLVYVFD